MATNFKIILKDNDVEKAIRKMKKKIIKSGLMKELRQRRYFEKGSERRIRKQKEMIINSKKKKRERERRL